MANLSGILDAPALQAVLNLFQERTGLCFGSARREEAERGVRRAFLRSGVNDGSAYVALLRAGALPLAPLITELTVGETYFFRERRQLEFIRRELLRRRSGAPLRVWSAGCASGEEAYSIAALLDRARLLERAEIYATDLCQRRLERARRGEYADWAFRNADESFRAQYFSRTNAGWRVASCLRAQVQFQTLNLNEPLPGVLRSRFELILCRNVLLYFDKPRVQRVARALADALAPGGWLLTGAADPLLAIAGCELRATGAGAAYHRPERAAQRSDALRRGPLPATSLRQMR